MLVIRYSTFFLIFIACCSASSLFQKVQRRVACGTCLTVGRVTLWLLQYTKYQVPVKRAQVLCYIMPHPWHICQQFIESWLDSINYIAHNTDLGIANICSIYIESCGGSSMHIPVDIYQPTENVLVQPTPQHNSYPSADSAGGMIAQVADIHLDTEYSFDSSNQCEEPICCRSYHGYPYETDQKAGICGDYNCDSPQRLVDSLMRHLRDHYWGSLDYVMWTGDTVPHDFWKVTSDQVISTISKTTKLLLDNLPGTAVIPVIGNHDTAPVNYFPPPSAASAGFNASWLYGKLAKMWEPWLPRDSMSTFLFGGYYSVDVTAKFKIIVLNTNIAYRYNFFVVMTANRDADSQLFWLSLQLKQAEANNQRCHIIGHVSPSDPDIIESWSSAYYNIISAYTATITSQFFSHTHLDEVQVHHTASGRPAMVTHVAASLTAWKNVNPGYRVYTIDNARAQKSTWAVIDSDRWMVDLSTVNNKAHEQCMWRHLYTTSRYFQMRSLSPAHWAERLDIIAQNSSAFDRYYTTMYGDSAASPDCDSECRQQIITSLSHTLPM